MLEPAGSASKRPRLRSALPNAGPPPGEVKGQVDAIRDPDESINRIEGGHDRVGLCIAIGLLRAIGYSNSTRTVTRFEEAIGPCYPGQGPNGT